MNESTDLSTYIIQCEEEAIHTPGCIQPHGFLIVLKEPDLQIIQLSKNVDRYLGIDAEDLLNQNLNVILEETQIEQIKTLLESESLLDFNPINIQLVRDQKKLRIFGLSSS